jgi:Na+-driven multidrug efflux pump
MGLSMVVSTLVGQNMGAGNIKRAERVTILGAIWGFAILTVAGMVIYLAAPFLVAFFVPHDARVIAEGAHFIRTMCLAWGGIGVQLCIVSAFRASGNMVAAMVIALVSQVVIQVPLAYLLSRHLGLEASGLWWSFPAVNIVAAIVSVWWFMRGSWKAGRLTRGKAQIADVASELIAEEGIR